MEIIHERAKLRLMDNTDVETLFSIVEEKSGYLGVFNL